MGFPGGASGKEPACQCRRQKRSRFDPLKEGWATHFRILAWKKKIPWTEESGRNSREVVSLLIIVCGNPFLGLCFQPLDLLFAGLPGPGIVSDFLIFLPGFVVTSTCAAPPATLPPRGPASLAQVSGSSVGGTQLRPCLILTQL